MQMRQRDVAALDAKYTKELADAKAENDALRREVECCRWSSSVTHQSSLSVSAWSHHRLSVVNATSPTGRHRWTGLFHPQREADHYAKTTGRNPEVLMSSADRVAHIDGQLVHYCEQYTRFQRSINA